MKIRNPETSMSVPIDGDSREKISGVVCLPDVQVRPPSRLPIVPCLGMNGNGTISYRSRPPKVVGVKKNTQMVSP